MTDQPSSADDLADFETSARAFLDAHAERRRPAAAFQWGTGSDNVALFKRWVTPQAELDALETSKRWRQVKFDAGYGWITGPKELGGAGLSPEHARLWNQLERAYATPGEGSFAIGLGMVAPTIAAHGQPSIQQRYLGAMYRGDIVGCQLFSEPGAGSDLASLTTTAVQDGREWIINGQKVWTSGAHYSDLGLLLCRSDTSLPKHRGLTAFIVDMRAPGVEIRPLRQMTGTTNFNEVFLTDVRIPDDHRLGDINGGWAVALTTLMNERSAISESGSASSAGPMVRIGAMLHHFGVHDDPIVRNRFARLYTAHRTAELTHQRARDRARSGHAPGPIMSIGKLARTQNMQAVATFVAQVLGPQLQADTGEWGTYSWAEYILGVPGHRLGGGTDEVMRNILAERVLGLPKDPS